MEELGSPVDLTVFARWCRAEVDAVMAEDQLPALLVAHAPDFSEPLTVSWHRDGEQLPVAELLDELVPVWIEQTGGSQVAVSVPFAGARFGVSLVVADETGFITEQAYLDHERLRLGDWQPISADLDIAAWQIVLAENAGWVDFAKWRCQRCGSVCPGEASIVPTPCDFCSSTEISHVSLATPLRDPDPPYDFDLGRA